MNPMPLSPESPDACQAKIELIGALILLDYAELGAFRRRDNRMKHQQILKRIAERINYQMELRNHKRALINQQAKAE